ncbi:MAG: glycosyltransferase family 2 protein, partial [Alphaproteobacteria bacterium]
MKKKPLKRIAAITMARNDEFFLSRWIKYYGDELGYENLYIYLDGTDQVIPENAGAAHITKLPHTDMTRATGDKYRIGLISDLANKLLSEYDIVIGCDCDEFLIVDPNCKMSLREYLSNKKIK